MIIGFGNNVVSSLAADITATQTTIQVMPGAGALFAGLLTYDYANDSNLLKTYAKITLTDAKETVFEVCHLTAVNNDMLTVVRGQEGTAAKGWSLNDVIANFATRGSENQFVQIEQLQSGHYTSAVAGGTANGLTLALPATFFLNGSTDWALKTPLLIYPILNNTGASTLQLTMGGRVMGTYPLVKGSNTALRVGDIVAKNPFLVVFNADQGRFVVLNPTTNVGAVLTVNSHTPDAAGNVKLGTAADADIGTSTGNVIGVGGFGLAPSLTSLSGVDLNTLSTFGFYVVRDSTNTPLNDSSVWFLSVRTWDSKSAGDPFRIVQIAEGYGTSGTLKNRTFHRTYSGNAAGWSTWVEFYSEAHKPTAADINSYTKQEADGRFIYKTGDTINWLTVTDGLDTGNDVTVGRTLYIKGLDFIVKQGLQDPVNNYRQTNGMRIQGAGNLFVDIYQAERIGQHHFLGIHVANGGADGWYEFSNDGSFSAGATVCAGGGSGGKLYQDGNLSGSIWGGYLSNWLNQNISNAQNNAQNWAYQNLVQNVRLTGRINQPDTGGQVRAPDGCVFTGMSGANYDPSIWGSYSYVQVLINGSWRNIGTS
ncbi:MULTISPECIES: pyocin knob domain-containing protein [unclassified Serratia (in: enterobacteria)]|uniref:pyocin knob domain-containing protein n=1 Tax=unclassified Serratia (in: enterobacteria) TaxID=2647522 RepID=UPI001B4799E4|nr:pyocin knob domain-containing protein [Serratia sp. PL17]MBP1129396.1 hypothetical protein [Serratia sp. PL17]